MDWLYPLAYSDDARVSVPVGNGGHDNKSGYPAFGRENEIIGCPCKEKASYRTGGISIGFAYA